MAAAAANENYSDRSPYLHLARKPMPWRWTLAIQAALCLALYAAFNVGTPQQEAPADAAAVGGLQRERPSEMYFLSVRGGSWPPELQTQLLKQMESMAKIYKPKFVLNIAEIGENDPLWHNATLYFQSLKIPWYTTTTSQGQVIGNFLKKIKMPNEQVLEIIGVDTGALQDALQMKQKNKDFREQMDWLQQTLAVTNSDWRIVVGFDPLVTCDDMAAERIKFFEPLRHIFWRYGVSVYLSTTGCAGIFYHDGAVLHTGNPGPTDEVYEASSTNSYLKNISDMHQGFLLHRVSPLEIESYLIDSEGRAAKKFTVPRNGRALLADGLHIWRRESTRG